MTPNRWSTDKNLTHKIVSLWFSLILLDPKPLLSTRVRRTDPVGDKEVPRLNYHVKFVTSVTHSLWTLKCNHPHTVTDEHPRRRRVYIPRPTWSPFIVPCVTGECKERDAWCRGRARDGKDSTHNSGRRYPPFRSPILFLGHLLVSSYVVGHWWGGPSFCYLRGLLRSPLRSVVEVSLYS